ncbi:MAG TPA: tripartite tricarboxylate transporter substrate binding protein [Burkholderiaceae bacterium]|nr:tripartite tricarboxylate transporter substrate binding protein [Burkholderiaceae bacterium]
MIKSIVSLAFATAALFAGPLCFAQAEFPDRPLRLIVTFPPGGSTDIVARLVAQRMSEGLGKPVVVENRPGAAGDVGTAEAAHAQPDGYTLLFHIVTTAVLNPIVRKAPLSYDPVKDVQPVAMIAKIPNVMIVNKDIPAKNLNELIAWVKANPGKFAYGSSGTGGAMHISGELLKKQAALDLTHVPYKGSAPAMVDLIGGRVILMFDNITGAIEPIRSGQVRAIAVTTEERVSVLSSIPTMAESGLAEFKNSSWFSIFTRAGVPRPIVARLEAEALKAINHPDTMAKLKELGAIPTPMNAGELDKFWKAEMVYWRDAIRDAKVQLD